MLGIHRERILHLFQRKIRWNIMFKFVTIGAYYPNCGVRCQVEVFLPQLYGATVITPLLWVVVSDLWSNVSNNANVYVKYLSILITNTYLYAGMWNITDLKINDKYGSDENVLSKWKHLLGKCISNILAQQQHNWKTIFLVLNKL